VGKVMALYYREDIALESAAALKPQMTDGHNYIFPATN